MRFDKKEYNRKWSADHYTKRVKESPKTAKEMAKKREAYRAHLAATGIKNRKLLA